MFNQFEGDEDERKAKLDTRLATLKRAREDGFFDEEGTESADIVGSGINPCDLGHVTFTGETPEPKIGELGYRRPMSVIEAERKRRENQCRKCRGMGDLTMYGGELERCPECGGTGRDDTPPCFVCAGRGYDIYGGTCAICNGRGLEPTQR